MLSNILNTLMSFDYNYTYTYQSSEVDPATSAFIVLISCCYFIFMVILYLFVSYCYMKMAENVGLGSMKWFAWIPILNIYLLVLIVKKDVIWFILCLIPFVNFVALIVIFLDLLKRFGKPAWYIILLFIPLVNLIIFWQLANSKPVF